MLGERSGNNNFLIDGQPNKDTVSGGAASQFNQETIAEFQVLTAGFRAEFGQASGAIVNVITKSGGNEYHGLASIFFRNNIFDSSNSLDPTQEPKLRFCNAGITVSRWAVQLLRTKFSSSVQASASEKIVQLNFIFPPGTPQIAMRL